ncbi:hypothetical protein D3C86_1495560 [compost metagenome]
MQCLGYQDDPEHDEPDVDEDGRRKGHDGTSTTKLCPRLDHLRQAQLGSLVGVQGHEQRTKASADGHRQDTPENSQAHARPSEADHHGKKDKVAGEPEWTLMPDLPVPLGTRDIIDGTDLDCRSGLSGLKLSCHIALRYKLVFILEGLTCT